ncbi:MAG: hypothetical protein KGL39_10000 [Patescibacteria group bacterium]|nr:hypothetical protein [Patescibacteria group bacterium]
MPTMKNREPEKQEKPERKSSSDDKDSKSFLDSAREKLMDAITPDFVKKINKELDKK